MREMQENTVPATEKCLNWLASMKQPSGYAGPVTHYWSDCLNYIGPGTDWRYEGLISAFIELYKKTLQKEFLRKAIEAGNFVVKSQKANGSYQNSGFESNPSFHYSYMPHESAATLGLLYLCKTLKSKGNNFSDYFNTAKKNLQEIHLKKFFDYEKKTFAQYQKGRMENTPNRFVPNKIATACEAFIEMHSISKEKKWLDIALNASNIIFEFQEKEGEMKGCIYQENSKDHAITYYTARCIPLLEKVYRVTGKEEYLDTALLAAGFIERMWDKRKGFAFGFVKNGEGEFTKADYPVFMAGSGDVIRALMTLDEYKKINVNNYLEMFFSQQDVNGGFRTATGFALKKKSGNIENQSWRDCLHVVGWNDKALRVLALFLPEESKIKSEGIDECKIECSDGILIENTKEIRVEGKENYVFDKKLMFSGKAKGLKEFLYGIGLANNNLAGLSVASMLKRLEGF